MDEDEATTREGTGDTPHEPVETRTTLEVGIERSPRYGAILIGGAVAGAVIAAVLTLLFPLAEDAEYTMGQAVGFIAILGAAAGLTLGGVLALILGAVSKRQRGSARAVQSDVR